MKFRRCLILCVALVGLALLGEVAWWVLSSPLSLEQKVQIIKPGMSLKKVEQIMGGPGYIAAIEEEPIPLVYIEWCDNIGVVQVYFNGDHVSNNHVGMCVYYWYHQPDYFRSR